jgi:hypothetical protein
MNPRLTIGETDATLTRLNTRTLSPQWKSTSAVPSLCGTMVDTVPDACAARVLNP